MDQLRIPFLRVAILFTLVAIPSASASAQSQTLIYDEFNGTTGSTLQGHAPDTNVPASSWSVSGNPGFILWGSTVRPPSNGGVVSATIDSHVANGNVAFSWLPIVGENPAWVNVGLIFRYAGANSYWMAYYFQDRLYLNKTTPSGEVGVTNTYVGSAIGSWHRFEVRLDGPSIQVWWDGQQRMQVSDSASVAGTRHGIWVSSAIDAESLIDAFTVVGAPPLTLCRRMS
jgi:hypothetical protein